VTPINFKSNLGNQPSEVKDPLERLFAAIYFEFVVIIFKIIDEFKSRLFSILFIFRTYLFLTLGILTVNRKT